MIRAKKLISRAFAKLFLSIDLLKAFPFLIPEKFY
ncbi:hypothetical protein PB1_15684 [Bacillus methanolicus PB1]|uniref:Uncharacterized protein n=1 Tax=Bacillus methanolicus PB1 TaxID=997296 RepID=I3DXP2_BACMT|nr:hypothetical protein PB1_15684 [Bacillus methanolicus PB1]